MHTPMKIVGLVLVAALGVGAAVAVTAQGESVTACVAKRSGAVSPTDFSGRCSKSALAVTISKSAFAKAKNKTLTINGVAFKRGARKTITINGTAFRTGTLPNSITINGTAFRTGTLPRTLTINGTEFRTGTLPNTLTINGTSFQTGKNGTLTINGVAYAAPQTGPTGPPGPAGAPGTVAPGPPPTTPAGIDTLVTNSGQSVSRRLASTDIRVTDGKAHRLLVTGGFNVVCNPCGQAVSARYEIQRDGESSPLVTRQLTTFSNAVPAGSVGVSEIIVTPVVCGPCTFGLSITSQATPAGAGMPPALQSSDIRLGLVDLGPVTE